MLFWFPWKRSENRNMNIKDLSKLHFKGSTPAPDTSDVSNYNVGNSDYHTHRYQPWHAW